MIVYYRHKAVLEQYEKVENFAVIDGFLTKASGYQFYNISKYTFESLLADPEKYRRQIFEII